MFDGFLGMAFVESLDALENFIHQANAPYYRSGHSDRGEERKKDRGEHQRTFDKTFPISKTSQQRLPVEIFGRHHQRCGICQGIAAPFVVVGMPRVNA
ncbi:hypothetical protein D3C78_1620250 [compost metagenome]